MMASRTRNRISIACDPCRKVKRKCDGLRPICTECKRHSRLCIVTDVRGRRSRTEGKEYIKCLEEQVKALTAIIKSKQQQQQDDPIMLEQEEALCQEPLHDASFRNKNTNSEPAKSPSAAQQELGTMRWKLSLDNQGVPSFTGPASALSFLIDVPQPAPYQPWPLSKTNYEHVFRYLKDRRLVDDLLGCFWNHVNPWYQFVNYQAYRSWAAEGTSIKHLHQQALHCAMLAAGACYSNNPLACEAGKTLALYAESLILPCYHTMPSLSLLQALSIMSWRELMLGTTNLAWMHLSLAASLVVQLGIHVLGANKLSVVFPSSSLRAEIRAFWSFYFVDRLGIAILGRSTLHINQIQVPPFEASFEADQMTDEQAFFGRLCRLWYVHDCHMDRLYSVQFQHKALPDETWDRLFIDGRDAFNAFRNENIEHLTFATAEPVSLPSLILQMSYHVATISVNRPFLRDPRKDIAQLATQAMITSSVAISHIVKRYRTMVNLANAPPFVMYHLVRAAVTHLFVAASKESSVRKRVSGALQSCTDALEEMRSTWPLRGEQTFHLIRELAAQWKVTWALPLKLSQPLTQRAQGDGNFPGFGSALDSPNAAIENNYWNIESYLSDMEIHTFREFIEDDPGPRYDTPDEI